VPIHGLSRWHIYSNGGSHLNTATSAHTNTALHCSPHSNRAALFKNSSTPSYDTRGDSTPATDLDMMRNEHSSVQLSLFTYLGISLKKSSRYNTTGADPTTSPQYYASGMRHGYKAIIDKLSLKTIHAYHAIGFNLHTCLDHSPARDYDIWTDISSLCDLHTILNC
jgi:hypothetical protein